MAKPYSPKEIAYLIDNYLEPPKIIGRHLCRSAAGVKQMIRRLDDDGRIIRPVVVKPERAWYRWEVTVCVNASCELNNEIMITAEEFFRKKIKEHNPNREVVTLSQELITAEQGMRWANEFQQLHLHDVVGRSERLTCDVCGSTDVITAPPMGKNCNRCNPLY